MRKYLINIRSSRQCNNVGKYYKYTLENTEGAINKRTMQRNWQYRVHSTMKKQNKHITQYGLDTTMRKQTQIT